MKKTACLSLIFLIAVVFFCFICSRDRYPLSFQDNGDGKLLLRVRYEGGTTEIKPWYCDKDGITYYFLPGCVDADNIWCGQLKKGSLFADDNAMDSFFSFNANDIYNFTYKGQQHRLAFKKTAKMSSIFIKTDSGSLDYIHEDKENRESGTLLSLDSDGKIKYNGGLSKISGHGNYTWIQEKKPYNIKLSKQGKLCGQRAATDWNLLSMWYDGDKIHSKIAFDIASILGAQYVPSCSWVDLYINGDYMGLYLLAESISGMESFNLGKGEFLIEKEFIDRYNEGQQFIYTNSGSIFSIVRPKEETRTQKQVDEIAASIQKTEDAIANKQFDDVIDVDSFAIQTLVEEISLNFDAFVTSTYMYKPADDEKIYAGPAWDYDGAFAEYLHQGDAWVNPDGTVIYTREDEQLKWYVDLYNTDAFRSYMINKYEQALPQLSKLFSDSVTQYAGYISGSVKTDRIRWQKEYDAEFYRAGAYKDWDSNVRYLKYFGLNRLKCLAKRWEVLPPEEVWEPEDIYHTVTFTDGSREILNINVRDGDTLKINDMPGLTQYSNGYWTFSYDENMFSQYLPVLEDCTLVFHSW